MSTNRDLLKEAIADAKTIKHTAIENAKAYLEESFTPHLKSMLSAKLQEMDDHYQEDEAIIPEVTEVETSLEETETTPIETEAKVEPTSEVEEEINLDELLAELELDETETPVVDETAINENEDTVTEKKDETEEPKNEKEEDSKEEDEEIDLENMTEEDLKNFIETVIGDMISTGEIEGGETTDATEEIPVDAGIPAEEVTEEALDLDEILSELKKSKKEEVDEVKKAKEELDEAMKAIQFLRTELNEINLLNAKLLYTNKIFKSSNLNESQKVKVLAAFDKATSKKEAQLVYETLTEGLKNRKPIVKEHLGRASKPVGIITDKKPILESNEMVQRFQKLAGIITD